MCGAWEECVHLFHSAKESHRLCPNTNCMHTSKIEQVIVTWHKHCFGIHIQNTFLYTTNVCSHSCGIVISLAIAVLQHKAICLQLVTNLLCNEDSTTMTSVCWMCTYWITWDIWSVWEISGVLLNMIAKYLAFAIFLKDGCSNVITKQADELILALWREIGHNIAISLLNFVKMLIGN